MLKAWENDIDAHVRPCALAAARQIIDGPSNEADETIIKVSRAKAQLAATLSKDRQRSNQIRKHFNLVEDEVHANHDI